MEDREMLNDHEKRICDLERNEVQIYERLDGTIRSLDNLTGWVKALVVAIFLSLAGLFISNLF